MDETPDTPETEPAPRRPRWVRRVLTDVGIGLGLAILTVLVSSQISTGNDILAQANVDGSQFSPTLFQDVRDLSSPRAHALFDGPVGHSPEWEAFVATQPARDAVSADDARARTRAALDQKVWLPGVHDYFVSTLDTVPSPKMNSTDDAELTGLAVYDDACSMGAQNSPAADILASWDPLFEDSPTAKPAYAAVINFALTHCVTPN